MAGKQITELESTNKISEGDLLFVRKTTSGTDKKINYTDLVESIGNPAIDGFVAIVDPLDANTIILTPANNARIPRYFVGMKISFVSPITSTGNVKIKVGSLTAKDFVHYHTTVTVDLQVDDYVEGVFITDKFHRVNDLRSVQNIYSNEYKVILIEIASDESYTDIHLVSSIGLTKTSYYDGMSISFRCTEDTKGATKIFIDGLDSKFVIDGDAENFVLTPLYANQPVHAIYSSANGAFIRDRYVVQDPTIVALPNIEQPSEQQVEDGIIPDLIIPVQNLKEYTIDSVSTGNNSFTNFNACVNAILQAFPAAYEQGIKVNITINITLDASSCILNINRDLSWITLRSTDNIITIDKKLTGGYIFIIAGINSKFFTVKAGTTYRIINVANAQNKHATFLNMSNQSYAEFVDATFISANLQTLVDVSGNASLKLRGCTTQLPNAIHTLTIRNSVIVYLVNTTINAGIDHNINMQLSNQMTIKLTLNNCTITPFTGKFPMYAWSTTTATARLTVDQTNSKAKLFIVKQGQGDQELAPNTKYVVQGNNVVDYVVVGSQT